MRRRGSSLLLHSLEDLSLNSSLSLLVGELDVSEPLVTL